MSEDSIQTPDNDPPLEFPKIYLRPPPYPQGKEKEAAALAEESTRSLTDLTPGEFRVEIASPVVLRTESIAVGRMLRFTLTWALRHKELGLLGCSHDGCLFMRSVSGGYRWSLPMTRRGARLIHNFMIFPDFYAYVLSFLVERFGKQVGAEDIRFLEG